MNFHFCFYIYVSVSQFRPLEDYFRVSTIVGDSLTLGKILDHSLGYRKLAVQRDKTRFKLSMTLCALETQIYTPRILRVSASVRSYKFPGAGCVGRRILLTKLQGKGSETKLWKTA